MTPTESANHPQPYRAFCPELNRYCRGVLIIEGTETQRKYTIEEYGTAHEVDPSTVEEISF